MDISVVIPLYNKAPHIQRAINSILCQTYPPTEIIVVDDGSTDGGGEIVKSNLDPRIRCIQQENSGVSAARNRGISESTTAFIAFLDADDEWKPEHLQKIALLIEGYPECGAFATSYSKEAGSAKIFQPQPQKGTPTGWKGKLGIDHYLELSVLTITFLPSSICVRKELFDEIGVFDVGIRHGEDLELWLRILLVSDIAFLNEPCTIYHLDSVNRSKVIANYKPRFGFFIERVEQLMVSTNLTEKTQHLLYEFYCHHLLIICSEALKQGYRSFALECLRRSSKTKNFRLRWYKWYFLTIAPNRISALYLDRWISNG